MFLSSVKGDIFYLKRTKMQDFDQNFTNIFRGCYPRTLAVGEGHVPPHFTYPPMLSNRQYFRRFAATGFSGADKDRSACACELNDIILT